jgi:hypothetical protein
MPGTDARDRDPGRGDWEVPAGFNVDAYLEQPLVARVATAGRAGPTVRPIWYLWEEGAFWWLTGGWSSLPQLLDRDPRVALVIDSCDLSSGEVLQVSASGVAELRPFESERARRWGRRYFGPNERHWRRFRVGVFDDPSTRFVVLEPGKLRARDLSF